MDVQPVALSGVAGAPPLRPGRKVLGISAVVLPFGEDSRIAFGELESLLSRTTAAGLIPAVNMDTGYVNLLSPGEREAVLDVAQSATGGEFAAGAFVGDEPGVVFALDDYRRAAASIAERGGLPVIFPSYGLTALRGDQLVEAYAEIGRDLERFVAFELGEMFVPFGRIYDLADVEGLMRLPNCIGMKHSSLDRRKEWDRLRLRDEVRPDWRLFTGNDLAIDMVRYGSDYLLGLSAFAPDHFARRDRYWAECDPRVYELDDALQALGAFAFRDPVPAYKHSAAQFLHLRGWISCSSPHPQSLRRPDSDVELLSVLLHRLEATP